MNPSADPLRATVAVQLEGLATPGGPLGVRGAAVSVARSENYRLGLPTRERRLDADVIKTYLIEQAVTSGVYADLLGTVLADGHPVLPAELAPLMHTESVDLIDRIRADCLASGENVIIEGTLIWPPTGLQLLNELVASQYEDVRILDVEVRSRSPGSRRCPGGGMVGKARSSRGPASGAGSHQARLSNGHSARLACAACARPMPVHCSTRSWPAGLPC